MKHLWQWVLFEFVAFNLGLAGAFGCAMGCQALFSNMPLDNPILVLIKGCFGVLVGALGAGFLLELGFVVVFGFYLNLEVCYEEKELDYRK